MHKKFSAVEMHLNSLEDYNAKCFDKKKSMHRQSLLHLLVTPVSVCLSPCACLPACQAVCLLRLFVSPLSPPTPTPQTPTDTHIHTHTHTHRHTHTHTRTHTYRGTDLRRDVSSFFPHQPGNFLLLLYPLRDCFNCWPDDRVKITIPDFLRVLFERTRYSVRS